jgi:hypothetical protein
MTGQGFDPGQLLQAAASLYARGEAEKSLELCLRLLNTPARGPAWELAALALTDRGRWAELIRFFHETARIGIAPLPAIRQWTHSLQKRGWIDRLDALAANLPADHPAWLMAVYYAASARLVAGRREEALRGFDRFRREAGRFMSSIPFAEDPNFNMIFRQGTNVLPAAETETRIAAGAGMAPALTDFRIDRPAVFRGDGPVLMAAADAAYTIRFAPDLLRSLDAPGRFMHFHVVNPTASSDRVLAELGLVHLDLEISRSQDRVYANATSYSCTRFFVLPHVLARHRRPVLALDADLVATPAFPALERAVAAGGFDFACFMMERNDPASLHSAIAMGLVPGEGGSAFLDRVRRFVLPRLAMPVKFNWMLDQAALISVINQMETLGEAFRFRDLNALAGGGATEFIQPPADELEKQAIKERVNGVTPDMVDQAGLVRYDWRPG